MEVLHEALLGPGRLSVSVESNGCTSRASFKLESSLVGKSDGVAHYILTVLRLTPDDCKMVPTAEVIVFDLERELGLKGRYTYSLANRVLAGAPRTGTLTMQVNRTSPSQGAAASAAGSEDVSPPLSEASGRLRSGLRQAVIFSLESEMKRYDRRKDEKRLSEMREALTRFLALKPEDIPLPEGPEIEPSPAAPGGYGILMPPLVREVEIVPGSPLEPGSVLDIEGMTRSGPFYHLAGAENEALETLKAGGRHRVRLHLVFKREYFGSIPDYYVYIAGAHKQDALRQTGQSKEN